MNIPSWLWFIVAAILILVLLQLLGYDFDLVSR
jgi:hypothetical protein